MSHKDQVQTADGINIAAGIWLILSPYIFNFYGSARTSDVIVGIIIGVLALIRVSSWLRSAWLDVVNALLGIWLFISAFVLSGMTRAAMWDNIIVGIVVAVLAIWSYSATYTAPEYRQVMK